MEKSFVWLAILLGLGAIILLCRYIYSQIVNKPAVQETVQPMKADEQALSLKESLEIMARALLDQQVEVSEGSIRIKVLIDHFDATLHEQIPFSVFNEVYILLEHMPTHQARKQTDKKFLHKLDQQRFTIEKKLRPQVLAASKALIDYLGKL
mgnify:CR=1 FL=1